MKKRSYTDEELIKAVSSSTSIRQVLGKLHLSQQGGGSYRQIQKTIQELNLDTSHFTGKCWNKNKSTGFKRNIEDYLSNKHSISSHKLKLRLIREGYFEHRCSICQNDTWQGKPIPIELDHLDGNHYNNNLNNLRIVCPNCHAQTPNHAGLNKNSYSSKA